MDTFAILHIRAWLDAENDKQTPSYQQYCSPKCWASKRAWHRELMVNAREKVGLALGRKKGRKVQLEREQRNSQAQPRQVTLRVR